MLGDSNSLQIDTQHKLVWYDNWQSPGTESEFIKLLHTITTSGKLNYYNLYSH